ncbi:7-cyano-7-deazaguanine synthase [Candidatus Woesearchaeota archaeon]|nr:7-cyano-7-deazaguanine synthase [Candidatus Woesearchaeota archaeon]
MEKKASIVLLSGGLDSCVAATIKAVEEDTEVYLLSFDYESPPSTREEEARQNVSRWLRETYPTVRRHEKINITGYLKLRTTERTDSIPQGYPFTRDEAFMLLGASWLERLLIEKKHYGNGEVVIATTKEDTLNFEDIHPEVYVHLNGILDTKYSNKIGKRMRISTPLIDLMKDEVVRRGIKIGAPLEYTWSCYFGEELPCKRCDQCNWRAEAFAKVDVVDPLYKRVSGK